MPEGSVFAEHLKAVVENVEGGRGGLIMGLDGIAVDTYVRDRAFDVSTIGMEFSFILTQAKKASDILKVGGLSEFVVRAESMWMLVRMLNDEYFVAVILGSDGNFGRCRFLMRLAEPKLRAEL